MFGLFVEKYSLGLDFEIFVAEVGPVNVVHLFDVVEIIFFGFAFSVLFFLF